MNGLEFVLDTAALRTDLDHAPVFAGGGDHLLAFENVVAGWFLDVDVLAGLAGPDGRERVPVIRDGHGDGLHFFVVEDLPHIGVAFGLFAGGLFDSRLTAFEGGLVDVAQGDDVGVGEFGVLVHMVAASSAQADDSDIDLIVCSDKGLLLAGGNGSGGGKREKSASGRFG